ncbi:MAG: FlhC family transcriptional regulator [Steroidobacteraceae bacterium]
MRICDDRYSRDRSRYDLALRFIENEARTRTIRVWTGLSDDRIRKLYRSYMNSGGRSRPVRHRGKSPQQTGYFTRSARVRCEASLLASLCSILGALPTAPLSDARRQLPGVGRGGLLCHAFEIYRQQSTAPQISFEHAVLLVTQLACSEELVLRNCAGCGAQVICDRYALRPPHCHHCLG